VGVSRIDAQSAGQTASGDKDGELRSVETPNDESRLPTTCSCWLRDNGIPGSRTTSSPPLLR
jgi:hypothetical protein